MEDDVGYIVTKPPVETSVEGVYAAGDARPRVSSGNYCRRYRLYGGDVGTVAFIQWSNSEFHQAPETLDELSISQPRKKTEASLRRSLM